MKIVVILTFILVMSAHSVFAQDTVTTYYDKDWNRVQSKMVANYYRKAFVDKNNAWSVCDYYMNHQIQMTGTYKSRNSEIRHGHFIYYYENGNKQSEGEYLNDKKTGIWSGWYESGELKYRGNYITNYMDGLWQYWHKNGKKKAEGNFLSNVETGKWVYWNENGKLSSEEEHIARNTISYTGYSDNEKKVSEGKVVSNRKQGIWKYYNVDGRLTLQGAYKDDLEQGEWVRYFRNGSMTIFYKNGNPSKQLGGIFKRP